MYFDIVLVSTTGKQRKTPPQQRTQNIAEPTEGRGGSHPERGSPCTVTDQSWVSHIGRCVFFWGGLLPELITQPKRDHRALPAVGLPHVGKRSFEYRATETDLKVHLLVRLFVGARIRSMRRLR